MSALTTMTDLMGEVLRLRQLVQELEQQKKEGVAALLRMYLLCDKHDEQLAALTRVYANTVAMLERTNQDLESQRAATYQAVEREHTSKRQLATVTQERDDYQEVHEDKQRLVRKLDVIWNGEAGAATQASLCDLVAQIAKELPDVRQQLATARREVWEEAAQLCEQLYDASNDREAVFYEELLTAAHAIRTQAAKEEA